MGYFDPNRTVPNRLAVGLQMDQSGGVIMDSDARHQKIRRCLALLKSLRNVAEEITLVGSFGRGGNYAIKQFNLVLNKLRHDLPDLELDLFEPLPANSVDPDEEERYLAEMGVAAIMLIKYLSLELKGVDDDDLDYDDDSDDEGDEEDWDEDEDDEADEDFDDADEERGEDEEDEEDDDEYDDDQN